MSNDLIPTNDEMKTLENLSAHAVKSKFFDKIGPQGGLLSIMIYAKELGLPPMQCLFGGMHNIQGKIEISASLMNSMIRKAGHKLEIIRADKAVCTIKGTRKDTGETYTETFTWDDAITADLLKNPTWKKYPKNMLFARCIKNLARMLFSDVIGSAYVEGEVLEEFKEKQENKKTVAVIASDVTDEIPEQTKVEEVITMEMIDRVVKCSDIENLELIREYMEMGYKKYRISYDSMIDKWEANPEKFKANITLWSENK
jgi:hypothetical protein